MHSRKQESEAPGAAKPIFFFPFRLFGRMMGRLNFPSNSEPERTRSNWKKRRSCIPWVCAPRHGDKPAARSTLECAAVRMAILIEHQRNLENNYCTSPACGQRFFLELFNNHIALDEIARAMVPDWESRPKRKPRSGELVVAKLDITTIAAVWRVKRRCGRSIATLGGCSAQQNALLTQLPPKVESAWSPVGVTTNSARGLWSSMDRRVWRTVQTSG